MRPAPDHLTERTEAACAIEHWEGRVAEGATWHVYRGDARAVVSSLPEDSFDCVITSPPYYWLRHYGVPAEIGREDTVQGYVNAICAAMEEVQRVLKPDGTLFLNLGDTYYSGKGKSHGVDRKSRARRFGLRAVDKSGGLDLGLRPKTIIGIPWRVALQMTVSGWMLRSPIVWNRKYALPEYVGDRPRRCYEYVFMFSKSRKYYFDRGPLEELGEEDMWTIATRPKTVNGLNTAPFPDELVQRCLDIGCPPSGTVLDPFAGSGTALRVAVDSGRSATGVDLSSDCCDYMVRQLRRL